MSERFRQTTLPLYATAEKTFEQYLPGDNEQALAAVQGWVAGATPRFMLLWSPAAVGKSHLIQAGLRALDRDGVATMYVPLKLLAEHGPGAIAGLDGIAAVGLDDIDVVAGNREWETAVFNLFNAAAANDTRLLMTAAANPRGLDFQLADLQSRLTSGLAYQLAELGDSDKRVLLQTLAAARGIDLNAAVADYIVSRYDRDLRRLYALLERIDAASFSAGRRITIPFVRELFD